MAAPIVQTYRWPFEWVIHDCRFFPRSGAIVSTSSYTGSTRAAGSSNSPWVVSMNLPPMVDPVVWKKIRSLLMKLRGPMNILRLFDPASIYPVGVAAGINMSNYNSAAVGQFSDTTLFTDGTGFRDGSLQAKLARNHYRGETNIFINGLTASQALSLADGDMLEVGGFLYSVVADVASNSSGETLAPIMPPLRNDIVANSQGGIVNFDHPTSPFIMANKDYEGFDVSPPAIAQIGLSFIERLP